MYQQDGNLPLAETNYAKAYQLLPDEANEKALAAVRKARSNRKASVTQKGGSSE